jgi:pimeloyl-ACP methyl ester carboxylesterase
MPKRVVLLILVLGVVPAFGQGYTPVFEEGNCPFPEVDRVTCGYLVVPEDRANPDGLAVELAVAIINPANGDVNATPVIFLEGGPGGIALSAVDEFPLNAISQERTIILVDQRGTGFSRPSLNCPEMEAGEGEDPLADCYDRLVSEGVNLSNYNSTASAADINDLREVLGYEQVNLWGISYGTRLGLTIIRNYPEIVNAAALDSVFPPEVNPTEQIAQDTQAAYEALFAACAADAACNSAYPDLETTFYDLVIRLNDEPLVFNYYDFDLDEEYERELLGEDVLSLLFQTLYNSEAIPMLPYGITLLDEATDEADYTDAVDILSGFWTVGSWTGEDFGEDFSESVMESDEVLGYIDAVGDISDSEGMFTAVTCAEETAFEDADTAYDAAEMLPDALYDNIMGAIDFAFLDCEVFAVDPAPDVESTRVQGDIPTLLIAGGLDPVTPVSYAESALAGLSNGTLVVFPFGGHSLTGSPGCGASLIAAYFSDPSAPLDMSCVPQTISFYVE